MGPFFPHSVLLYFRLGISLQACLLQIVGYRNLIADVEKLRREPYDSDNPQHEEMLLKVSPSLMSVNYYQALRPGSLFHWGYKAEGTKTWELWRTVKAEFSCWLRVIFSSENSYEKLTLKPVDSYNLRKHQRLFLWGSGTSHLAQVCVASNALKAAGETREHLSECHGVFTYDSNTHQRQWSWFLLQQ